MTATALAKRGAGSAGTLARNATNIAAAFGASPEVYQLVRSQVAPSNAPDEVLALYFARCQQTGSDPMGRMLYIVNRKNKGDDNWRIEATIDFFRAQAEASGEYSGQEGPYWCGDDGEWVDAWLRSDPPAAAKVGIKRKGFDGPLWAVARFDAYYGSDSNNFLSKKMGDVLIAKVAEMLAFRKAFPQRLNGIYGAEEMTQANNAQTVYNASATPDGTVQVTQTDPAPALPAAAGNGEKAAKLTLSDLTTKFARLKELGDERSKSTFLASTEGRWMKKGAKPVAERARSGNITFSDTELANICAILDEEIAKREQPATQQQVDETEVPVETETEVIEGELVDERGHHVEDEIPIQSGAETDMAPTQQQVDDINKQLRRLFGRDDDAKEAILKEFFGCSTVAEIEVAADAAKFLEYLKKRTPEE